MENRDDRDRWTARGREEGRGPDDYSRHIGESGDGSLPSDREVYDLGDRNPSQGFSGGFWGRTAYGTSGQNRYGTAGQGHMGRGPKGYRRSDERIEEEINEALTRHPDIDATDVEVRVQGGEVTLSGEVEDRYMKRAAEDIAEHASGVHDVHNHIKVRRGRTADR